MNLDLRSFARCCAPVIGIHFLTCLKYSSPLFMRYFVSSGGSLLFWYICYGYCFSDDQHSGPEAPRGHWVICRVFE